MRLKDKIKAIELRQRGSSYSEICQELKVSKSTCSLWLRGIQLNEQAIQRLVDNQERGRAKASLMLRQYRTDRDRYIKQRVDKSLRGVKFSREVGKLLCAALYWGEGAKTGTSLTFTNSDPRMVSVYMRLLRTYFPIEEGKFSAHLHLHSYHGVKKQKSFWSKITHISPKKIYVYRKINSGKNIRPGYPGCISIRYYDVRLAKEIEFLYSALISKFGGVG